MTADCAMESSFFVLFGINRHGIAESSSRDRLALRRDGLSMIHKQWRRRESPFWPPFACGAPRRRCPRLDVFCSGGINLPFTFMSDDLPYI